MALLIASRRLLNRGYYAISTTRVLQVVDGIRTGSKLLVMYSNVHEKEKFLTEAVAWEDDGMLNLPHSEFRFFDNDPRGTQLRVQLFLQPPGEEDRMQAQNVGAGIFELTGYERGQPVAVQLTKGGDTPAGIVSFLLTCTPAPYGPEQTPAQLENKQQQNRQQQPLLQDKFWVEDKSHAE